MSVRGIFAAMVGCLASVVPHIAVADCAGQAGSCTVAMGSYEIALPETPENAPVFVYLHGYGGTGMGALRQSHITRVLVDRGYAVLAPNALKRGGTGPTSWSFHPERPKARDEGAFFAQAIDDAVARFGLDRDRAVLAGFSIGGSMTHYVACETPDLFAAYAPVAGSFWRPHPIECAGSVRLLHTHGWRDGTFPLEGRIVGSGFTQGDAFVTNSIWRAANDCPQPRARKFENTGPFMRRSWTECAAGTALEFALFDGGHVVPNGWADLAADWFEALPRR
ncbi:alpha/beta fold hydrolase [Amylibacter sp. IMCC11727]|uniref:alpha/beta hydrolase family esterase n=1 Tax=Amylibacter sp. IMCC11727 TaxID=3039851 RepID=UPI00244E2E30|nr:alpha/beta fold hydrolase [Amylibacter sp. IMCC11727]WGI23244.1 PHB depolymerase family esterase [Amylibacter sp. IMCC11727]